MMGTLKQFYRNVLQNRVSFAAGSSEQKIYPLELESHLMTAKYGHFTLTDAVRPSFDLKVVPEEGYKYDRMKLIGRRSAASLRWNRSRWLMPIIVVSVSLERLFDAFLSLLNPLGDCVDITLETSHCSSIIHRARLHREHIDLPVLSSFLYDHEDVLLHDGCTGIAVTNAQKTAEVRFDEHKLITICAKSFSSYETILRHLQIPLKENMPLLSDAEHIHMTKEEYFYCFKKLQMALGMDESYTTAR